ncbi:MAG: LEPR-XLL domain-containing protein [Verrucomicrobiales bacterium]|nr:LEPR-XLL domain-containing protein [Verrucomicrobiales bacterium]
MATKTFFDRLLRKPNDLSSSLSPVNAARTEIESLEPRILFSGAPVEAPAAPEDAPADSAVSAESQEAMEASVAAAAASADATKALADEASATPPGDWPVTLAAPNEAAASLNAEALSQMAEAARQRWIESGLSAEQVAALDGIVYQVADLPGFVMAEFDAAAHTITLDADASGIGWFIDSTPGTDEEFGTDPSGTAVQARDRIDLLSVLLHEQGHVIGLPDSLDFSQTGDVMFQSPLAGQRRLPTPGQAEGGIPGDLDGIHRATVVVSTQADAVNGTTSSIVNLIGNSGGDGISLREAIIAANNTAGDDLIQLAAGTYSLSLAGVNEELAATGDLDIRANGSVTITGLGKGITVIDAAQIDRVFDIIDGATLILENLTVTGGALNYSHGAGFYARYGSTVLLTDVEIRDNVVQSTGSGDRHGGGFWSNSATITGTGVDLTNNRAERNGGTNNNVGGGGWISGDSMISLTDVTVTGNVAREGGGFYVSAGNFGGSRINLTNATIENNTAVVRGGGFDNAGIDGVVTIDGGSVSQNVAQFEHGGGIYNYGTVHLSGVMLVGNEAQDLDTGDGKRDDSVGGGFYNNTGIVVMTGGALTGNTVYGSGGGFYNRVGSVTLIGTGSDPIEIANNKAGAHDGLGDSRNGGGFYNTETGTVNLTHVVFTGNHVRFATAGNSATVTGVGAGFFNTGESTVNLDQVDISQHIAAEGGAFYQDGVKSMVVGSSVTLDQNVARTRGGAFRNATTGGVVQLTDSSITGNTVQNEHGGGFYTNGTVILTNTRVENNQALDLDAGGVNLNNNSATPSAGPVQRDSYGGGFYNTGGKVEMTGGTVSNNQTYGHGGGFFTAGGLINLDGTTIEANSVLRDPDLLNSGSHNMAGGGFYSGGDGIVMLANVRILNNILPSDSDGNTRGAGGGFFNADGSTVDITGASVISGNRAEDGGGFYNTSTGSIVRMTGTTGTPVIVTDNTARVRGGAFRTTGDTEIHLEHVEITHNDAETQRGGGFYADGAFLVGSHVKINNNIAGSAGRTGDEQGGGFWLDTYSKVELTDSEINGNHTEVNGGGFFSQHGSVTLTRTEVNSNTAVNSGGGAFIEADARLFLNDSSIDNNVARDHGGGIWASGDADISATRTRIDGNITGYELDGVTRRAADLRGGGFNVRDRVRMTLTDSTVDGNAAAMYGGAGYVGGESQVTIIRSTMADNIGGHHGGAFFVESSGRLELENSTLSGNYAGFRIDSGGGTPIYVQESVGGAIWTSGGATVTKLNHVTITNNFATRTDGAGIHRSSGSIFIENSIIFGNIGNAEGAPTGTTDTLNAMTLIGANIIGVHGGSGLIGNVTTRLTTDPGLAALADNGGFGRTHAIGSGSSAAEAALGSRVAGDQRGEGRQPSGMGTVPAPVNATGADLLSDPAFTLTDPDRNPTVTGTSLNFPAGGADNETLFSYRIVAPGEVQPDQPVVVTVDFDFTKITVDHDVVFLLSDGTNTVSLSMNDNNGGEIFFGPLIVSGGEPAIGVAATVRLAYTLSALGTSATVTRGTGQTGSGSSATVLNVLGGLTFSVRLGNAGERTQLDGLAITVDSAVAVAQGGDLGAYEVDATATTLTLDELTVPENIIGDRAFQVRAVAASGGAGPLVYQWTLRDEAGSVIATATGDETSLTASLPGDNPVQRASLTLTVTDTATGQSVTQTRETMLVQADAAPVAGSVGSLIVDTGTDVVDGTVTSVANLLANRGADGRISLREAVLAANADTTNGSVLITIDPTVTTITLTIAPTANENASANGDIDFTRTRGAIFLKGNGLGVTTIHGGGIDRVLDILTNAEVYLQDLKITGGVTTAAGGADHGAGFRNVGGTVVLQNVDLAGNDSTRTSDNVGGGFYSTRSGTLAGRVIMTGGFIRDNFADSHGGGFYVDDPNNAEALIYLKDVVISGNIASNAADRTDRDGGGFYFTGSRNRLEMESVIIENNSAKDDGGGFYWANRYGSALFDDVILRGNTTNNTAAGTQDSDGAGFGLTGTGNTIVFTDSHIGEIGAGNVSENDAGGFKLEGKWNLVNLIDTAIEGNSTLNGTGGGFWNTSRFETVTISGDSRIASNVVAHNHGGGFRNEGVVNIIGTSLNPIEIVDNLAGLGATGNNDRLGGGFFNTNNGTVTLTDVILTGNVAYSRGGGFLNNGGARTIINASDAGTFRSLIANNSVTSNEDDVANQSWRLWGVGGGFYNESAGSLVDISDTIITANLAVDHAAGFFTQSNYSQVNLTRVDITEHETPDAGAGIYNASTHSAIHLDTVLLDRNVSTTNHGGAIRNQGIITGRNATFTRNAAGLNLAGAGTSTADLVGGAIYNSSASISLIDSVFDDNYARGRGGAIYTDGGSTIDISSSDPGNLRSRFSGNWVDSNSRDGGALYISSTGNLVRLTGVDLINNIAGRHGGGFYLQSDGARVELADVLIDGNVAANVLGVSGQGGGFHNASAFSTVTMDRVTISNNVSRDLYAGGFHNRGRVFGTDVVISANVAGQTDRIANNDRNLVGGGFRSVGSESITDLTRVVIADNTSHGRGGGFYSDSSAIVRLTDFVIRGNSTDQGTNESQGRGAGFWNSSNADVTLNRGEISDNESFGHGAGFYQQDAGSSVSLTNVTISGNRAGVDQNGSVSHDTVGGGFWAISSTTKVDLNHVTITNNRVNRNGADAGAGFRVDNGGNLVTMRDSIVFGNFRQADTASPIADDVDNRTTTNVDFQLSGTNIIGVRTGNAIGGTATALLTGDPLLQPLADLVGTPLPGGFVMRGHLLAAASPAIDAATSSTITTDQRGASRPNAAAEDLGAVEMSQAAWSITGDTSVNEGQSAQYTISLDGLLASGETAHVDLSLTDIGSSPTDRSDFFAAIAAAIAGRTDLALAGSTLTFTGTGAPMADVDFSIATVDDALVEVSESYVIALTNPGSTNGAFVSGGGSVSTAIVSPDPNTAPTLAPITDRVVQENGTVTLTAIGNDVDQPTQTLLYTLDPASLAKGMSINPLTGAFTWTPDFRYFGSHSVTVTVSDQFSPPLTASRTFSIQVNPIPVTETTWIHLDLDGNLVIDDFLGGNSQDQLHLEVQAGSLVIRDPRNNLQSTVLGGTPVNSREVRIGLDRFTGDVVLNLLSGHDTVTLGNLTGLPGGIRIDGGNGFDQIRSVTGSLIQLGADGDFSAIAETISLARATITASGTGGIALIGTDPANAGIGRSYIGVSLVSSALNATGSGSVVLSGSGSTLGSMRHGVMLQSGSSITVGTGDITITGSARSTTSLYNSGVFIHQTTLAQTGAGGGAITIVGTGNGIGSGNTGITLSRLSQISALGQGSISLTGHGGGVGVRPGANDGIRIEVNSALRSVDGDITLNGTAGATGGKGINLLAGTIISASGAGDLVLRGTGGHLGGNNTGISLIQTALSTGTGGIDLHGQAGNGTHLNIGLYGLRSTIAQTAPGGGSIRLTGIGDGTGTANHGVILDYLTQVAALGNGSIDVAGTATGRVGATFNNVGLAIMRSSAVTAVSGTIQLHGSGAAEGSGASNRGILVHASQIRTTGAGDISLTGTGGKGTHYNDGVLVYHRSAISSGGWVSVIGSGGGTGLYNHGVFLSSATITSSLPPSITGTGGGQSGNRNHGIYLLRSIATNSLLSGTKGGGSLSRDIV